MRNSERKYNVVSFLEIHIRKNIYEEVVLIGLKERAVAICLLYFLKKADFFIFFVPF